jgi:hypothetical protein
VLLQRKPPPLNPVPNFTTAWWSIDRVLLQRKPPPLKLDEVPEGTIGAVWKPEAVNPSVGGCKLTDWNLVGVNTDIERF